jgi:PTS system nitrogen regulatory IIA component
MYLSLVQLSESFGVSESVVIDWIRKEGLPHTPDRGCLLFDRALVADWAMARGLAGKIGFLAPADHVFSTSSRIGPLFRTGGIWRGQSAADVPAVYLKVIESLSGIAGPVRQLLVQRLRSPKGVTLAPIGGGFAMPHLSMHVSLGRDSGAIALLILKEGMASPSEPLPDAIPITRLLFFIAPSPRAHLDVLGRLCRQLARGRLRELIVQEAPDEEIFREVAADDPKETSRKPL